MMGVKSDSKIATPYSAATGCWASCSAAFFVHTEAFVGDDFAFFDDVFIVLGGEFGDA